MLPAAAELTERPCQSPMSAAAGTSQYEKSSGADEEPQVSPHRPTAPHGRWICESFLQHGVVDPSLLAVLRVADSLAHRHAELGGRGGFRRCRFQCPPAE